MKPEAQLSAEADQMARFEELGKLRAELEERTRERDEAQAKLNEQLDESAFFHRRADEAEARVAALEAALDRIETRMGGFNVQPHEAPLHLAVLAIIREERARVQPAQGREEGER